jgi:hypothetical protein
MRACLIAGAAAFGLGLLGSTSSFAVPVNPGAIAGAADELSHIEHARVFCYHRYTGRFINWGRCRPRRVYRAVPRVYCYSRSSGRFLHWGSCRR